MGIFSVFSRKKKEQEKPAQVSAPDRIYYADLPGWLDSAFADRLDIIGKKSADICGSISSKKENLKEKIGSLSSEKFDPHDKTYAKVNMAKDTFVNKALAALNSIGRPDGTDYESLSGFRDRAASALNSVKNATPKQAILISNYFKKQSAGMVSAIRELDSAVSGLSQLLGGEAMLLKRVKEAKDSVAALADMETERRIDEINLSKSSVAESAVGGRITAKQSELDALVSSDEWKGYSESLGRLAELESRMKMIEQDANNRLSALRRSMKKLSHDRHTASLPENPFRDIVLQGSSIETMAKSVMEAEAAGAIVLKPSEREKISALSDADLAGLRNSYNDAASQRMAFEGSIDAGLLERKKSAEAALEELRSEKQRTRREVEYLEERIRRDNGERQKQLEKTRAAVQEAVGKEVNITLQKDFVRT